MGKKAAILTWCDNAGPTNYGQVLQCYAMQRLCEMQGLAPFIIRYRKKTDNDLYKGKFRISFINQIYEILYKVIIVEKGLSKRIFLFRKFVNDYICLSKPCYDKDDIDILVKDCTFLICGSDQIWNPSCFDPIYFLQFGNKYQRRIAYAPSGLSIEDSNFKKNYQEMGILSRDIDFLSVREEKGVQILRNYTAKNIEAVLDPTFLLNRDEWEKLISKRLIAGEYIFCYIIGDLGPHKLVLKEIMKKHKVKKLIFIPSNLVDSKLSYATPYIKAGPSEFLSLIKHAKIVCTDSFHGTTLSIVYRKQFYNLERYGHGINSWADYSRIDNVINKLHIGDRRVTSKKDILNISHINYDIVNDYLKTEISKSRNFLERAIR